MITIYDMNTSQINESRQDKSASTNSVWTTDYLRLELNQREVFPPVHSREAKRIPPELAIADLSAFLKQMS